MKIYVVTFNDTSLGERTVLYAGHSILDALDTIRMSSLFVAIVDTWHKGAHIDKEVYVRAKDTGDYYQRLFFQKERNAHGN